ncbi:glycosyltransferase family 2 protein [Streptomyces sp. enrichment culture]|uniref:glycosyltransferase family 2 protein n=1 Tax=Streptomyces sp. enrichment culture TaxID=1795815 RepID=UPI003F55DAFF
MASDPRPASSASPASPAPPASPGAPATAAVVVLGRDGTPVPDAVRSALAQGPAVREVIVVSGAAGAGLPDDPRLRVVRHHAPPATPRDTGLGAVGAPYVMFLDGGDVLPPGAVEALLRAAATTGAHVVSGLCVRRDLPSGRESRWLPSLYAAPAVLPEPARQPRLVHDTLYVNKLYDTAFLRDHGIRFPESPFTHEDAVLTARVWAARPRTALIPDRVYTWQLPAAPAASPAGPADGSGPAGLDAWRARTAACRTAHATLLEAGQPRLARAVRAGFLDHDLRRSVRELPQWDDTHRRAWWAHTRAFLSGFDAADWDRDPAAPGRLTGRVLLASAEPRDLARLRELAARPARLLPPYARTADGTPCWSDDLPGIALDALLTRPVALLPLAVDAELHLAPRSGTLRLHLHDLYGRVELVGALAVDVEWRHRGPEGAAVRRTVPLRASTGGGWTAETAVRPGRLAALGPGAWDLRLRLRFRDGSDREVTAHAVDGPGLLDRRVLPSRRHGVLLVRPYATHSGSLAVRVAAGVQGLAAVTRARLRRLVH